MKLYFLLIFFVICAVSAVHWDVKDKEDLTKIIPELSDIIYILGDDKLRNYTDIKLSINDYLNDLDGRSSIDDFFKTFLKTCFPDVLKNLKRLENTVVEFITEKTSCLGCRFFASVHFTAYRLKPSLMDKIDDLLLSWLGKHVRANIVNTFEGAVKLYRPILNYILMNRPNAQPQDICGYFQDAVNKNECSAFTNMSYYNWFANPIIDDPPPPSYIKPNKPQQSDLKIALISDVHLDKDYHYKSDEHCWGFVCCRNETDNIFGDKSAGYWGSYSKCDTPVRTYDRIVQQMSGHKDVDVVYYLGDALDHFIWEYTYDKLENASHEVYTKLRKSFPNAKIVSCVGNHESFPLNQFAPLSLKDTKYNTTWLYDGLSKLWEPNLDDDDGSLLQQQKISSNFTNLGCYSTKIANGLKVISLNNNVANSINWWHIYEPKLPKQYLDWLIDELLQAEKDGDKVHILTHMPPGSKDLSHIWTREYNRVIQRFANTVITAEFNGHTHADEFKLFYDVNNEPNFVAWNSGGANSYENYNLNYKIIEVNGQDYTLKSIKNYVFDLKEVYDKPNDNFIWVQLYEYPKDFGMKDLSGKSVGELVQRMHKDQALRNQYNIYYFKDSKVGIKTCDDDCVIDHISENLVTVLWESSHCEDFKRGISSDS